MVFMITSKKWVYLGPTMRLDLVHLDHYRLKVKCEPQINSTSKSRNLSDLNDSETA
jgi:hypothetical protein